jgi:hypothetical protein
MLRKLLLSNIVVAGLMLAHFPAIAVNPNFTKSSAPHSSSFMISQEEIDADALNSAAEALEKAANEMNAADATKNPKDVQKHFNKALTEMELSAVLLKKAGIPKAAKAMNSAIVFVKAAAKADTEVEQNRLVKEAEKSLHDVVAAVEEALK